MNDTPKNPLEDKLKDLRSGAEERDAKRRSEELTIPYLDLRSAPISLEAFKMISEKGARLAKAAFIQIKKKNLTVCVFDPREEETARLLDKLRAEEFI